MTNVWNDKNFAIQIFQKKIIFAPITPQVFLKHPPGHEESIGILGNKIGPWVGLEKNRTNRQTDIHTDIRKLLYGYGRNLSLREHPLVTSANFGSFLTYLPTLIR